NTLAAGTELYADRLEQNIEGIGDSPSAGSRSIYLEQFGESRDLNFAVYRYVVKYSGVRACAADEDQMTAVIYVSSWLSGYYYSLDGLANPERLAGLRALSPEKGNDWFVAHASEYFSCTLSLADLP
ncbi:MAG: hypothetical protein QM598_01335, partial [Protaetiibacter sp.]